ILQVRPITRLDAERELQTALAAERARLWSSCAGKPAVWINFSISDVLPRPSGLVVDFFQSGEKKGETLSLTFKRLGIPVCAQERSAIFESVCGRMFINFSAYFKSVSAGLPIEFEAVDGKLAARFDWRGFFSQGILLPFRTAHLAFGLCTRFLREWWGKADR